MKKHIFALALGVLSASAFAQSTVGQAFNVTASLSSRCVSNNATPSAVDFGAYTAFGAATNTAPTTTISFRCTKNFAASPTASLGTGGTSGSIAGLAYTLAIGSAVKTSGTGATGTSGTYDVYSYTITGTMAAGQAGDASIAAAAQVHTLTITY